MPISPRNLADHDGAPDSAADSIQLGGATVELARHAVRRADVEVRLRPRTADVLGHLIRHRGRVVSKQELIDAVWGSVAVTDDSLVQCLIEVRRALGADHGLVRTVRGRGYLLDLPLHPDESAPVAAAGARRPAVAGPEPDAPAPGRPGWSGRTLGLAVSLAGAVALTIAAGPAQRHLPAGRVAPSETLNEDARRAVADALGILGASRAQVDLQRARQLFATAIDLDPAYAPGHAGLGNVLVMLSGFGVEAPFAVLPRASAAARRAVALDPTLAAGWQALAHVQTQWDWDWEGAERSYRRAIALDPTARFNMVFAHLLAGVGRGDEAVAESERWLAVQPSEAVRLVSNCVVKYLVRRYAAARAACDRAIAVDSGQSAAHFWRALTLVELGEHDAAMVAAVAAREAVAFTPTWVVGYLHARAGRRDQAREVLRATEARAADGYVPPVDLALLHAAVGDHGRALDWLERGQQERGRWMELLAVLAPLDPLRGEPRFRALLRALRLPDLT